MTDRIVYRIPDAARRVGVVTLNDCAHVLPGRHDATQATLADLYDGVAGRLVGRGATAQCG